MDPEVKKENKVSETTNKTTTKPETANVKAEVKEPAPKKAAAPKAASKKAAPKAAPKKAAPKKKTEVIIQSPFGGEITEKAILAKVGEVDTVYVRVDHNKAYWVKGEDYGAVDLW